MLTILLWSLAVAFLLPGIALLLLVVGMVAGVSGGLLAAGLVGLAGLLSSLARQPAPYAGARVRLEDHAETTKILDFTARRTG